MIYATPWEKVGGRWLVRYNPFAGVQRSRIVAKIDINSDGSIFITEVIIEPLQYITLGPFTKLELAKEACDSALKEHGYEFIAKERVEKIRLLL